MQMLPKKTNNQKLSIKILTHIISYVVIYFVFSTTTFCFILAFNDEFSNPKVIIFLLFFVFIYFLLLSFFTKKYGILSSKWISIFLLFSIIYILIFKNLCFLFFNFLLSISQHSSLPEL